MLVQQKLGRFDSTNTAVLPDCVELHWYETNKRILHKKSNNGIAVSFRFLNENPQWATGDIIFQEGDYCLVIDILPVKSIVLKPTNLFQMASLCYEIGNKHLPLFYENEWLLIPFDAPLHNMLTAAGYEVLVEERKLNHPLKTTVAPHSSQGNSLFNRILQLTGNAS